MRRRSGRRALSSSAVISAPSKVTVPASRLDETQECAPERCLPGTGLADNTDVFAAADPNVDAVQDGNLLAGTENGSGVAAIRHHEPARDQKVVSHRAPP